jgi:hypothetical protein
MCELRMRPIIRPHAPCASGIAPYAHGLCAGLFVLALVDDLARARFAEQVGTLEHRAVAEHEHEVLVEDLAHRRRIVALDGLLVARVDGRDGRTIFFRRRERAARTERRRRDDQCLHCE